MLSFLAGFAIGAVVCILAGLVYLEVEYVRWQRRYGSRIREYIATHSSAPQASWVEDHHQ